LAEQLLRDFEFSIKSLTIIPSDGGRFEVSIDGDLIYSKLQTGRHAEYTEIKEAVEARLKES